MVYVFLCLLLAVFQAQASDNSKNYFWHTVNSSDNVRKATVIATVTVNESLRVSDIKRGETHEIFACRGEGHGQLRVTMIILPPPLQGL